MYYNQSRAGLELKFVELRSKQLVLPLNGNVPVLPFGNACLGAFSNSSRPEWTTEIGISLK